METSLDFTHTRSSNLGEYEYPPTKIGNGIYLGNRENSENKAHLKDLGVTHILNTAKRAKNAHPDSFKYMHLKLEDTEDQEILPYLEEAFDFIDQATQKEKGGILIHCMSGMSRSATILAAYLIQSDHFPNVKDASSSLEYLVERREIVDPNEGFRQQLEDFSAG